MVPVFTLGWSDASARAAAGDLFKVGSYPMQRHLTRTIPSDDRPQRIQMLVNPNNVYQTSDVLSEAVLSWTYRVGTRMPVWAERRRLTDLTWGIECQADGGTACNRWPWVEPIGPPTEYGPVRCTDYSRLFVTNQKHTLMTHDG